MGQQLEKLAGKHGPFVPELNENLTEPYPLPTGGVFIPMSPYTGDLPLHTIPQMILNAGMKSRQYQDCIYEINAVSIAEYSRVRRAIQRLERGTASWDVYRDNLDTLIFRVTQICQDLNFFILENYNILFVPFISVLRDETNGQHFGIIVDWKDKSKMEKKAKKLRQNAVKEFEKQAKEQAKKAKKQSSQQEKQKQKPNPKQQQTEATTKTKTKTKTDNKTKKIKDAIRKKRNTNHKAKKNRNKVASLFVCFSPTGKASSKNKKNKSNTQNENENENEDEENKKGMGAASVTNSENEDSHNDEGEMYDEFELPAMSIKHGLASVSELSSNASGCTSMTSVTSVPSVTSVGDSETTLTSLMMARQMNINMSKQMQIASVSGSREVSFQLRDTSVEPPIVINDDNEEFGNENHKNDAIFETRLTRSRSYTASNASKFGLSIYLPRHLRREANEE